MAHKHTLIKFLKTLIFTSKTKTGSISPFGPFLSSEIPEELQPSDEEELFVTIADQEYYDFYSAFRELRGDKSTEYLSDKELKEKLWYAVCDVLVNEALYKKDLKLLDQKVDEFLSEICKPIEEFEVMLRVKNFELDEGAIQFWDCLIARFDKSQ